MSFGKELSEFFKAVESAPELKDRPKLQLKAKTLRWRRLNCWQANLYQNNLLNIAVWTIFQNRYFSDIVVLALHILEELSSTKTGG